LDYLAGVISKDPTVAVSGEGKVASGVATSGSRVEGQQIGCQNEYFKSKSLLESSKEVQ